MIISPSLARPSPSFPTFGVEPRKPLPGPFAAIVRVENVPRTDGPGQGPTPSTFNPSPLSLLSAQACIHANGRLRNPLRRAAPPLPLLLAPAQRALADASRHLQLCPDRNAMMALAEQHARQGTRTVTELCASHAALRAPDAVRRLQMAALQGAVGTAIRTPDPIDEAIQSLAPDPAQAQRFDTNALRRLDPVVHQAVWLHIKADALLRLGTAAGSLVDEDSVLKPGSEAHRYLQNLAAEQGEHGDAVQTGASLSGVVKLLDAPMDIEARETLECRAVLGLLGDRVELSDEDLRDVARLGLQTEAGSEAAASPVLRWLVGLRNVDRA